MVLPKQEDIRLQFGVQGTSSDRISSMTDLTATLSRDDSETIQGFRKVLMQ